MTKDERKNINLLMESEKNCRTVNIPGESIPECARVQDDKRILAIVSDEVIAKEAMYHPKCYRK